MTVAISDNLTDAWAPERAVMAALEKHKVIDGTYVIPPEVFVLVAARISQFKDRPVTDGDMEELKRHGCDQNRNRKTLNLAAKILRSDIDKGRWSKIPGFAGHVKRWKEAIAVLQMPRSIMDNPHHWLHPAEQGPAMKGWSFMATEIAVYLMQALKGYGVSLSFGRDGGIAAFIREALGFIGLNDPPSQREISKVINKNLSRV
jgi:hypothetical protein